MQSHHLICSALSKSGRFHSAPPVGASISTDLVLHPSNPKARESHNTLCLHVMHVPAPAHTLLARIRVTSSSTATALFQVLLKKLHNCPVDIVAMLAVAMCQIPPVTQSREDSGTKKLLSPKLKELITRARTLWSLRELFTDLLFRPKRLQGALALLLIYPDS